MFFQNHAFSEMCWPYMEVIFYNTLKKKIYLYIFFFNIAFIFTVIFFKKFLEAMTEFV